MRKGAPWVWGAGQTRAFEETKKMLCSTPLLTHFDPSRPILVQVDASPYGLGAVMAHKMEDGREKPVCYVSRTLSEAEQNHAHIEKEGLALVFAVKKLHQYLYGNNFTLFTDHKPLLGLFAENKPIPSLAAARIQRWAIFLAAYNYRLEYRAGSLNGNADCLSRLPISVQEQDVTPNSNRIHMMNLVDAPVTVAAVRLETRRDPTLSRVYEYILNGWSRCIPDTAMKPYFNKRTELTCEDGTVLWGSRVVIPAILRTKVLQQLHQTHIGIMRMKALARSYVWWPNLDADIERAGKACGTCIHYQSNPGKAPIHCWEYPSSPWERVHLDYAGPFLGHMFLIVVDAHSKWTEVCITKSSSAMTTIEKLRGIFATHGLPVLIVSDNGPCFTSEEFKAFMNANGIRHIFTAPYHPSSNGLAERSVRTFKEALKRMNTDGKATLETKVNRFLFTYRITPNSSTGVSPAELMFKRRLRTAFHLAKPDTYKAMDVKNKMERGSKVMVPLREFKVADPVLVRNYGSTQRWIEGTITRQLGAVNFEVETGRGLVRRHVDQLVKLSSPVAVELMPEIQADNAAKNLESFGTPEVSSTPDSPDESLIPESRHMEEVAETPAVVEKSASPPSRKSGRIRRPPKKFADYVRDSE